MALWVHKYRPKSLDELDFHEKLTASLRKLSSEEDFPHILVYGPPGAGKQTRVACILRELYGPGALKVKIESRMLEAGTRKIEINLVSSVHHVEITPSEAGNQDRFVIQDLLKEIAQTQQVDFGAKTRFKVVVINEADFLSRDAQAALRRTMEIYSPNLRLILLATSISSIMGPIQSRTLLIRVPSPSIDSIIKVLGEIASAEDVEIQDREAVLANIADASQRNLRRAILMLEAMYAQNPQLTSSSPVPVADWEQVIDRMAGDIVRVHTVQKISDIRGTTYELIARCVPPAIILKTLTLMILRKVSSNVAPQIIEIAAKFDHRLRLGSKAIFHIEAFVAGVMRILELAK